MPFALLGPPFSDVRLLDGDHHHRHQRVLAWVMSWCLQLRRNPPRPPPGHAQDHPRKHRDDFLCERVFQSAFIFQVRQPPRRLPNPGGFILCSGLWFRLGLFSLGLGLAFGLGLGFFVGGGLGFTPINRRAHLEKVLTKNHLPVRHPARDAAARRPSLRMHHRERTRPARPSSAERLYSSRQAKHEMVIFVPPSISGASTSGGISAISAARSFA